VESAARINPTTPTAATIHPMVAFRKAAMRMPATMTTMAAPMVMGGPFGSVLHCYPLAWWHRPGR